MDDAYFRPERSFLCSSICAALVIGPSSYSSHLRFRRVPIEFQLKPRRLAPFPVPFSRRCSTHRASPRRSDGHPSRWKKVGEFLGFSRPLGPQLWAAGINRPLAHRSSDWLMNVGVFGPIRLTWERQRALSNYSPYVVSEIKSSKHFFL